MNVASANVLVAEKVPAKPATPVSPTTKRPLPPTFMRSPNVVPAPKVRATVPVKPGPKGPVADWLTPTRLSMLSNVGLEPLSPPKTSVSMVCAEAEATPARTAATANAAAAR